MKKINELTEEEAIEIWLAIGGTPHLFNYQDILTWLCDGDVMPGLYFTGFECIVVAEELQRMGYTKESFCDEY